ncbi:carboxypeptidase-like regulatory domain-containing protein [Telluribacter sp. SYSU D00476]|uniref:carboxypeptidase-like regulatory domain-containing protein n=1 Tax=Telluribacter sp. SYSU D00476 TaxID=2811430 RepID=UPI001FF2E915|nr:carboxypeptidase-like regulatory domain-containing protein [Telluribacter sp. SYSU D00476]
MKHNTFTWSGWASFLLLTVLFSNTTGCISFLDRTTTVYGRVTDDSQQPIDSLEVELSGVFTFGGGLPLATTYTDSEGNYKITYKVPKDFSRGNVFIIPSGKKFDKYKREYLIYVDGNLTSSCCRIPIGTSKNYDFLLLNK